MEYLDRPFLDDVPNIKADKIRTWILAAMLTWGVGLLAVWFVMWTVREMQR